MGFVGIDGGLVHGVLALAHIPVQGCIGADFVGGAFAVGGSRITFAVAGGGNLIIASTIRAVIRAAACGDRDDGDKQCNGYGQGYNCFSFHALGAPFHVLTAMIHSLPNRNLAMYHGVPPLLQFTTLPFKILRSTWTF